MNKSLTYYRFAIIATLCFCFTLSASAQKLFTITGVVFKKSTQTRVAQVVVNNITRKTVAMSDDLGAFHIQAAAGDSLLFKKTDYTTQTIGVLNDNLLPVYLQPIVALEEVKINDMSTRQELASTMNNYKRVGQYYTLHPSVGSVLVSPISGLYSFFGKAPARAKRFAEFSKKELEQVEVAKKYNKGVIKKVVDIPDEDMDAFMLSFTPSYEDIKVWSDYDIIKYIQRSYDYFEKNKTTMKPQKLY